MIKAIETKYKGYRFRSRLEARWAVFFETAGYEWVYEPEGFDLGGGDYYLPDFFVRSPYARRYSYVEIKPGQDFSPVRKGMPVYLAGAVSMPRAWCDEETGEEYRYKIIDDWRDKLSNSIPYGSSNSHFTKGKFGQYRFRKGYVYKGPHFYDDHGVEVDHYFQEDIMAINQSRRVFAWIDREECYGTVAEVAYAYAKGIPVYLALSNKLKNPEEYSFVKKFATESMEDCASVIDAWSHLMPDDTALTLMCEAERKAVKLSESLAAQNAQSHEHNLKKYPVWVDLIFGDPVEHSRWRFEAGTCFKVAMSEDVNAQTYTRAAASARSARFEHGENG